jgi:hypothetical protein
LRGANDWLLHQIRTSVGGAALLRFLSTHPSSAQRIANARAGEEATPDAVAVVAEELELTGKRAKPSTIAGHRRRQLTASLVLAGALASNVIAGFAARDALQDAPETLKPETAMTAVEQESSVPQFVREALGAAL